MTSSTNLDISVGAEAYPITYDDNSPSETSLQGSFKYVKTNIPGLDFNKDTFSEQYAGCSCTGVCTINTCFCLQLFGSAYDERGKLKVDRAFSSTPILECGHACSCNPEMCTNRIVQQGIKNKFHIFQTQDKGYGLMCDKSVKSEILALNFVCEYAGEVIGDAEARKRMKETDTTRQANYLIALREHTSGTEACVYIDPRYVGNVGRFINHSCDPNLFMVPVRVNHPVPRLALFARNNIHPGDELTFDYSGNASVNVPSDSITKVKPIHSPTFPPHSETEASLSSGNISLDDTQMDKMALKSYICDESESNYNPPMKRMKQTGFSQLTPVQDTETHDSLENYNQGDIKENQKTVQPVYETVLSRNTLIFSEDNEKTSVKRKPCLCGSHNCTGFLPLDSKLLSG